MYIINLYTMYIVIHCTVYIRELNIHNYGICSICGISAIKLCISNFESYVAVRILLITYILIT